MYDGSSWAEVGNIKGPKGDAGAGITDIPTSTTGIYEAVYTVVTGNGTPRLVIPQTTASGQHKIYLEYAGYLSTNDRTYEDFYFFGYDDDSNQLKYATVNYSEGLSIKTIEFGGGGSTLYRHSISLTTHASDSIIYYFDVISSVSTEFNDLTDVPNGNYAYSIEATAYLPQGAAHIDEDGMSVKYYDENTSSYISGHITIDTTANFDDNVTEL